MTLMEDSKEFNTPVQYLPGVGPKSAKKLAKLGVETIGDLIYFFPRKYLDYSQIIPIASLLHGFMANGNNETMRQWNNEPVSIQVRIVGIGNKKTRRRGFTVTEAVVEDGTGTLRVVWFNQPYLSKTLYAGREIILHGKVTWDQFNQGYVMESPDWAEGPKIVPVYRETDGVSSYYVAKLVAHINNQISNIPDFLPQNIIEDNGLLTLDEAIRILHGPKDMTDLDKARDRMAFDELFLISLRGQILKQELKQDSASAIKADASDLIDSLPYDLTGDQEQAWRDIASDLSHDKPMNRLLNGDVGSGKTVVSALAAYAAWKEGKSAILMAPTEILASQHYETIQKLLPKAVPIHLVVSSNKKDRKGQEYDEPSILIGTHALLYLEKVADLALVIIDEQHRFGVRQRQALKEMTKSKEQIAAPFVNSMARNDSNIAIQPYSNDYLVPHFLSMTATPIPRSLQLALFAELDVSVIREKPKNRKEIRTRVVDEANREKAYQFIRAHVKAGRQVFVVVPLIEETQDSKPKTQNEVQELFDIGRKTVTGEYEKLSKEIFPDLKIGMLHGRMKAAEKDTIMSQFSSSELDILVSTSVVEVGVDIPNASIMMIEDAERFGLAQLHQFRGRVGRGEHQSFCFLFSNSMSPKTIERIKLMETVSDGFTLAEYDLKNRGAGDIFGTEQSGFMDIKFANLSDVTLISKASGVAKVLAEEDPKLEKYPILKDKLSDFNSSKHFE